MTHQTTITPDPDGNGFILHLPEITHLDTQVWSADVGLTAEGLAALRTALAAVSAAVAPPTNRAELRDRIAEVLTEAYLTAPEDSAVMEHCADAVLAVLPEPADVADEVDADTVANRAAQVITTMGAEIRELKHSRDRYRTAWLSARHRVALRRTAVWVANIRWAADHLDNSERLRDLTDDHMGDINAAANELRRVADETATETPHTCDNCEGVNPDTCINDPSRPPERCPSCGHPVDGHDPYEGCVGPHGVGGLGSSDCPCTGEQLITGVQP